MAGIVSKELLELEYLPHVHRKKGVILMQPAGQMVGIPQWLTAKSPGRSFFTAIQTVVGKPPTLKRETAALQFYVYHFSGAPGCKYRYCSSD